MQEEITQQVADTIVNELLESSRMFEVSKDSLPLDLAARVIFDGAKFVGIEGLPSSRQFMEDYFQGIGPVFLVPKGWRSRMPPRRQVRIVGHECTHGGQAYADARMPFWYVGHTEARAVYEEEAFGSGDEIDFAIDGVIPESFGELDHPVREGYALTAGDRTLVAGLREQRLTSISHGVLATRAGRFVVRRLHQLQPGALSPAAVAKVRAGSPGLLS